MRVDVEVVQGHISWSELRQRARMVEELGFDGFWISDHLLPPLDEPIGSMLEAWTTLAALSRETTYIRLGTLVTAATFRHPALLAAQAATLDHLSDGRLDVGVGAGWFRLEHEQFGIPFPSASQRIALLDEVLTVLKKLMAGEVVHFDGDFFQLREAAYLPRPLQQPRPPIWIGASGERLALSVVARHADVWHGRAASLSDYERKSAVLDRYAESAARPPGTIRKCISVGLDEDPRVLLKLAVRLQPLGFDRIIASWPASGSDGVRSFATTCLPILREL